MNSPIIRKVKLPSTAQRIVKNIVSLFSAVAIGQLLTLVVMVYLARILGPGDFGKISFAMAIIAYFMLIANLGLPYLGTREVAREKEKVKHYVGTIIPLRLALAVLSFCLLLLLVAFINKALEMKYLLILYGLGLLPFALLFDWVFQGVERMGYIGVCRILAGVVYVSLIFLFIKDSGQLLLIPGLWVLASLLTAGLLIFIFVRRFGKPRLKFDLNSWRILLRQALPLGLTAIMITIYYNADTIMLGFMRSNEEVGYYNAAYKIVMFLIIAAGAYHEAIFPVMSNYYKKSLDALKKLQSYSAKLMVTLGLPLAVGGTLLARPIMNLIYGARYDSGVIGFQILIWAAALTWVNGVYGRSLWACDRENKVLKITIILAVTNITLNFILIPRFGLMGAAIATVAAEAVGFPLNYVSLAKIVKLGIHNYILRPLLACVIMGLFLHWGSEVLNLNVFWLILGGAFIYGLSFFLMKGVKREEIRLIQGAFFGK